MQYPCRALCEEILQYEQNALKSLRVLCQRHALAFRNLGCSLHATFFWKLNKNDKTLHRRPPFWPGYSCFARVEVRRGGETARLCLDGHSFPLLFEFSIGDLFPIEGVLSYRFLRAWEIRTGHWKEVSALLDEYLRDIQILGFSG